MYRTVVSLAEEETARRSDCPTAYALDLFGDRWTLLVVRDLMFFGRRRYGEFLEAGEGVATNILANRLERLGCEGVISSTRPRENSRAKYYYLTRKGIDLAPLMVEMILWSAKWEPELPVPEDFLTRAESDRPALLRDITARLEGVLANPGSEDGVAPFFAFEEP